ncbi:MAG: flagellar biosynthesis anti-sigma factor FlgM [Bacillota bacterium]|jgi:negative regulator of flagellin synthesis FlgM|nr:flagellar biosynthesis anti-sigma factor FlgM [Clostridia bacterium]
MKITGVNPPQAIQVYAQRKPAEELNKRPDCRAQDALDISPQARELQILKAKIREVPEVREEKVSAIREQLNRGDYQIDFDTLVENLLQEIGGAKNERS